MTWQLVIAMDRQEENSKYCAPQWDNMTVPNITKCVSAVCDVIYANQADHFAYEEMPGSGGRIKMWTTETVGVGKNRNLALALATGDLLLFADDDLRYEPGLAETLITAFHALPRADVIVFWSAVCPQRPDFQATSAGDKEAFLVPGASIWHLYHCHPPGNPAAAQSSLFGAVRGRLPVFLWGGIRISCSSASESG